MSDRAIPNQALLDFSNRKLLSPVPKNLYESARAYFSKKELDLLQTAYNVAFEAHKDQFRKEGSAYITHPVLSGPAIKRLEKSDIDELVVTNSIPLSQEAQKCSKIRVISLGSTIAECIKRLSSEKSLSEMFL